MKQAIWVFLAFTLLIVGCGKYVLLWDQSEPLKRECTTFDTAKIKKHLQSDYFERGGVELAKITIDFLLQQYECEKGRNREEVR